MSKDRGINIYVNGQQKAVNDIYVSVKDSNGNVVNKKVIAGYMGTPNGNKQFWPKYQKAYNDIDTIIETQILPDDYGTYYTDYKFNPQTGIYEATAATESKTLYYSTMEKDKYYPVAETPPGYQFIKYKRVLEIIENPVYVYDGWKQTITNKNEDIKDIPGGGEKGYLYIYYNGSLYLPKDKDKVDDVRFIYYPSTTQKYYPSQFQGRGYQWGKETAEEAKYYRAVYVSSWAEGQANAKWISKDGDKLDRADIEYDKKIDDNYLPVTILYSKTETEQVYYHLYKYLKTEIIKTYRVCSGQRRAQSI